MRRSAEFDGPGGISWGKVYAIVICEPGSADEARGGEGHGMAWHGLAGHGYTADQLETRPFLLCGIAVVWLPVVVSLCVWHGMARVNGGGGLPAQTDQTRRLRCLM